MRLEIPKFDGTDPESCVFKIEEFFNFHETPASLRLRIVSFHLEGKASAWYQWMKGSNLLTTWPDFLSNVKQRFGSSVYEDHQGNLSKLSQTSTVAEFQTEFEELMNLVTGIPEHLLISVFIAGLRPHLRREMLLQRPTTLIATFSLTRAYEARYEEAPQDQCTSFRGAARAHSQTPCPVSFRSQPIPLNTPVPSLLAPPPKTGGTAAMANPLPIRRLTPIEMQERRNKGLCFKCDQKWTAGHRCRSQCLLLPSDVEDDPDTHTSADSPPTPEVEVVTGDISSMNSLAGQDNPRSLRMLGMISSHSFHVLIDGRSTHNFMKPSLAEKLGLHVKPTRPFRVYIGNGDHLICSVHCPQIPLCLQGTLS
ncbi:Retrotransposon gag domain-containing protein [Dioscorea alata]|uniref:Retrotransposon gag domain-containing protein n=1 Tax=Dioscorea alata TaxID=55571 RepID=A0ACB7VEA3_DIOAL|nr:Retrotransposon gag domain-containing protein [Dioscorea alata]